MRLWRRSSLENAYVAIAVLFLDFGLSADLLGLQFLADVVFDAVLDAEGTECHLVDYGLVMLV